MLCIAQNHVSSVCAGTPHLQGHMPALEVVSVQPFSWCSDNWAQVHSKATLGLPPPLGVAAPEFEPNSVLPLISYPKPSWLNLRAILVPTIRGGHWPSPESGREKLTKCLSKPPLNWPSRYSAFIWTIPVLSYAAPSHHGPFSYVHKQLPFPWFHHSSQGVLPKSADSQYRAVSSLLPVTKIAFPLEDGWYKTIKFWTT